MAYLYEDDKRYKTSKASFLLELCNESRCICVSVLSKVWTASNITTLADNNGTTQHKSNSSMKGGCWSSYENPFLSLTYLDSNECISTIGNILTAFLFEMLRLTETHNMNV